MNPISPGTTSNLTPSPAMPTGAETGSSTTDELVLAVGDRWHRLHRRHKALRGRLLTVGGAAAEELTATVRRVADAYGQAGRALDAARPGATPTTAELAVKLRDALTTADAALDASYRITLD